MVVRTRVYHIETEFNEIMERVTEDNEIKKTMIKLPRLKCPYCFYEWIPRIPEPRRCPHCKNIVWRILQLIEKDSAYACLLEGLKDTM
jgi:predicted Zn-ribbon and HTH transcriptional regulator